MKAAVCYRYGGPDVITLDDIAMPTISPTQVLVKVTAAIVSPTDVNFRSGKPVISRLFSGLLRPKKAVHGEMFTGVIEAIGSDVTTFQVGDRVYGTNGMKLGSYAEYVAVDVTEAIKTIPENIDAIQALTLLDGGITALPFLQEAGSIQAGQSVLINGASGAVGSMAIMIAKQFGCEVTGVCSTANVETVLSLGADHVIDYRSTDFTAQPKQYDLIFDAVGKSSFTKCKRILTPNGLYLTTVPTPGILLGSLRRKKTTGKRAGFLAAGLRKPNVKIADLKQLEEMLLAKTLRPLIGRQFPLEQLGDAQRYVETGHKVGNVVVTI